MEYREKYKNKLDSAVISCRLYVTRACPCLTIKYGQTHTHGWEPYLFREYNEYTCVYAYVTYKAYKFYHQHTNLTFFH